MSADVVAIVSDTVFSVSAPSSTPGSPRSRVKFLCSHGGKILPRPTDGHLKYVGGETRVISVPRDIGFQELMKKLTYLVDGEMVLKYQLMSEDLDALVSVKSDEDLPHMFDEIDCYVNSGSPMLRAFLFPKNPIAVDNQMGYVEPQRYIDAINGIIRSTQNAPKQHPFINSVQQGSLLSSGCSSPRSPDSCTTEVTNNESAYLNSRINMHRVQSSPSICSMNVPHQSSHYGHQHPSHHVHQYPGYQSSKPQKSIAPERLTCVRSVGRAEGLRYQIDPAPQYYYSASRQNRHYDDCGHCFDRRLIDRTGGLGMRSVPSSPRLGQVG